MDDAALRFATEGQLQISLPRDSSCASVARRLVESCIGDGLLDGGLENAVLIASELVTNAYRHGAGSILMSLTQFDRHLRISVCDEGTALTDAEADAADSEHIVDGDQVGGRGLWIVSQVADRWGVTPGRSQVWAELMLAKA